MGTVEPKYTDLHPMQKVIEDDALAFIYGAIAKYGSNKETFPELKEYISKMIEKIGKPC